MKVVLTGIVGKLTEESYWFRKNYAFNREIRLVSLGN